MGEKNLVRRRYCEDRVIVSGLFVKVWEGEGGLQLRAREEMEGGHFQENLENWGKSGNLERPGKNVYKLSCSDCEALYTGQTGRVNSSPEATSEKDT